MNEKYMTDTTKRIINILTDLYGEPKFKGDEQLILKQWNEVLGEYSSFDVEQACYRLYKFNKIKTFPTLSHLLSELVDTEKVTKYNIQNETVPYELRGVYKKACVFIYIMGLATKGIDYNKIIDKEKQYSFILKNKIPMMPTDRYRLMYKYYFDGISKFGGSNYPLESFYSLVEGFKRGYFDNLFLNVDVPMVKEI